MTTYRFPLADRARSLSNQLVGEADEGPDLTIELDQARDRAVRAMAAQLRAAEATEADRQLVRAAFKRMRDVRTAR